MKYDDETLMAYADGALDADRSAEIRRASERDPAIARRIDAFRQSAATIKQAFDAELDAPVPPALLASVQAAIARAQQTSQPVAEQQRPAVVSVGTVQKRSFFGWVANEPRYAMAASVSALVIGVAGYLAGMTTSDQRLQTAALSPAGLSIGATKDEQRALSVALSETSSGQRRALGRDAASGQVQLVATFRDRAGTLCREFAVQRTGESATQGVACRSQEDWSIKAIAVVPVAADAYTPASGHAAVDSYLTLIEAGPPLSAQDEQQALGALRK
ncbi:MAG: anti-sigma factor family protein [Burkholderiaceae bacterium]